MHVSQTNDHFGTTGGPVARMLDNPIWRALCTEHASFAEGDERAKRYIAAVAPLSAVRELCLESFESLARLLRVGEMTGLFLDNSHPFPPVWTILRAWPLTQMVWTGTAAEAEHAVENLDRSNTDEMLRLVELTNPGPFKPRTSELGSYLGIRVEGRLVAMAGERLRIPGYTEISAVCTRPEFRGRGYASSLVLALTREIAERGDVPFLHVASDNLPAIRVYEKLGFMTTRKLHLAVAKKVQPGSITTVGGLADD